MINIIAMVVKMVSYLKIEGDLNLKVQIILQKIKKDFLLLNRM